MTTVFIMDVRVRMMCVLMLCMCVIVCVIVIASMPTVRMMCVIVCVCVLSMNRLCGAPVPERIHQGLEYMLEC